MATARKQQPQDNQDAAAPQPPSSLTKRRTAGVKRDIQSQATARATPRIKRPGEGSLIPFLTLDEVAPETVPVKIFGVVYDMVAPQDMSPLKRHTVDQIWQRMIEIQVKVEEGIETTEEDELELEGATNRLVQMVVPSLPPNVFDKLNWLQKEAIVEGFLAWKAMRLEASKLLVEMREQERIQTGPR